MSEKALQDSPLSSFPGDFLVFTSKAFVGLKSRSGSASTGCSKTFGAAGNWGINLFSSILDILSLVIDKSYLYNHLNCDNDVYSLPFRVSPSRSYLSVAVALSWLLRQHYYLHVGHFPCY